VQDNVRQALSELRQRLETVYGDRLVRLVLYGSQARGDARPWSDIDVLVVLKGPVDQFEELSRTEDAVADICLRFEVVIGWVITAETDYLSGDGPLLRNIRREGVPV